MNNKKALITKTITFAASCLMTSMAAASVESTTTYTYNSLGLVATIDGPRTDVTDITTFGYDTQGNRTSITNALSHLTQITAHDASGRPLTIVDPNGVTTQLTYDARGRLLTRTTAGQTTTMTYDNVGNITRITQPDDSYINYEYDAAHRLVAISDVLGNRIQYTLDDAGNRTQEQVFDPSNTLKRTHSNTFDELSRMIKDIGAGNQTASFSYDPNGNQTEITDPNQNSTTQAFDALNRLTQITDAASGNTIYGYDAQDNLTSVTDPRGNTTSYTYDALGNLLTQQSPDTGTSTFTYDEAGNRLTSTDAKGQTTNYGYDALNRITQISYADGQSITYSYDQGTNSIGRLTTISDGSVNLSYEYDNQGNISQLQQSINGITLTLKESYNGAGQLIQQIYPSGAVLDYGYTNGQLSSISLDGSPILNNISYAPFGPVTSWTWANGSSSQFNYDQDGRLSSYQSASDTRQLNYDPAGNIIGINSASLSQSYNYDSLDRVIQAVANDFNLDYTYDPNSNRIQTTDAGTSQSYSIDTNNNRLTTIDSTNYQYDGNGNLLTVVDSTNYIYDANGNQLDDGSNSYQYDARNRLVSINGSQTTYSYNPLGQRVEKTFVSPDGSGFITTRYFYNNNGQLIAEADSNGKIQREYIFLGDRPVALRNLEDGVQTQYEFIVDNQDSGSVSQTGDWIESTDVVGYEGDNYAKHGGDSGPGTFTWNLSVPEDGEYSLYAKWVTIPWLWRTDRAIYQFTLPNSQSIEIEVDQHNNSGTWYSLGDYSLEAGALSINLSGKEQYASLAADAIKIQRNTQGMRTYAIYTDQLGAPRAIADDAGNPVWRWDPRPFGDSSANEDPDGDGNSMVFNMRFPGQYYDQETGLYYNYYRYYDPNTGRYITSDPIGLEGGLNTYAYVGGNPLNSVDIFGLEVLPNPTWNAVYPGSFNTQGQFYSNRKAMCYFYCRLESEAICGPWDIAGGGVGFAFGGPVGFIGGAGIGRLACEYLLINFEKCMKRCLKPKECKEK